MSPSHGHTQFKGTQSSSKALELFFFFSKIICCMAVVFIEEMLS